MKKLIPLFIVVCFMACEPKKKNTDIPNTNIKSVIENEKLNVVYRGVANPFTIYMPNTDSIKVIGTDVKKISNNQYHLLPTSGRTMKIEVIGYKNGREIIDKREFRILDIQKPYASIYNQYKTVTLTKEELADATIKVLIPQFIMELPDIASFQYQINEGEFIENKGNTFNETAKNQILQLQAGDSVLINNVRIIDLNSNACQKSVEKLKVYIE